MSLTWLLVHDIAAWSIRLLMIPVVLRRRLQPVTALAWLTVIFFQPFFGLLLYMLIGGRRLGVKRVQVREAMIAALHTPGRLATQREHAEHPRLPDTMQPVMLQAERVGGMSILGGNAADFVDDNQRFIDELIADIDAAEHHVHMLYYIFEPDDTGRAVAEALVRARERGVTCRLLADDVGSRRFFHHETLENYLAEHGVTVQRVLPVSLPRKGLARIDLRNHRKLTVIDGRVAWTGSQNVVDPGHASRRGGRWHDFSVRFRGPIVSELQLVFAEDWACETDETLDVDTYFPPIERAGEIAAQAVATGPGHQSDSFPRVLLSAINHATRRVLLTTPYFVPDEPTLTALQMAAERGVYVDICLPARSDHLLVDWASRATFDGLLRAGVNIHQFGQGTLHAKMLTVDDSFALVGSSNIDIRSFYINLELNVILYGEEVTRQLRFAQQKYLDKSQPIDRDDWSKRPTYEHMLANAAALFSPLM